MARALKITDRRVLRAALIAALLLHVALLIWARYWLQPPSRLTRLPPPFYTRVLHPQAAPVPAPAPVPQPIVKRPVRPKHRTEKLVKTDPVAIKSEAVGAAAEPTASVPQPEASESGAAPELVASESAAAEPMAAASAADAAPPAFLDTWPPDTRLTYVLTGNYRRGSLSGSAKVLWQRLLDGQQARYQTEVQLSLGLLLSMRLTSQGQITEQGLAPQVYEEQVGRRRRHASIGDDVQLNNGQHVPRPDRVQDTASQFIELARRFASGQTQLAPGGSVHLWLARPTGVDPWTYDMLGEETLYLPRLGAVQAIHLKPRRLNASSGSINAEIWLAPGLQYLPVRILLTQGAESAADLMVDTIEQR